MSQTFNTCFKLLTCFSIVYVTKSTWRPTKCCHRSRDSTSYLHYKLMILCKDIWDKVFTDGPTRICGAQPLKNFTWSILEHLVSFDLVTVCHVIDAYNCAKFICGKEELNSTSYHINPQIFKFSAKIMRKIYEDI